MIAHRWKLVFMMDRRGKKTEANKSLTDEFDEFDEFVMLNAIFFFFSTLYDSPHDELLLHLSSSSSYFCFVSVSNPAE